MSFVFQVDFFFSTTKNTIWLPVLCITCVLVCRSIELFSLFRLQNKRKQEKLVWAEGSWGRWWWRWWNFSGRSLHPPVSTPFAAQTSHVMLVLPREWNLWCCFLLLERSVSGSCLQQHVMHKHTIDLFKQELKKIKDAAQEHMKHLPLFLSWMCCRYRTNDSRFSSLTLDFQGTCLVDDRISDHFTRVVDAIVTQSLCDFSV